MQIWVILLILYLYSDWTIVVCILQEAVQVLQERLANKLKLEADMKVLLQTMESQHEPMYQWLTSQDYVILEEGTGIFKPKAEYMSDDSVCKMVSLLAQDVVLYCHGACACLFSSTNQEDLKHKMCNDLKQMEKSCMSGQLDCFCNVYLRNQTQWPQPCLWTKVHTCMDMCIITFITVYADVHNKTVCVHWGGMYNQRMF
jgi:hypothetical protein